MRKFLILFLLSFSFTAFAVDLITIPQVRETAFEKVLRCTWHISCYRTLGTTLTTINGTDLIKNAPTTLNTNFTNLNNGKIEVGSTTINAITTLSNLTTIGTITSGTWNASNLTVSFGGTSSTTLATKRLMFGNGINGFQTINFGTNGQFLTSAGENVLPNWTTAAVDTTLNYNWTGNHNFAGATTNVKNLNASSTIVINGITYTFPSAQGASSTELQNNGGGGLTWNAPSWSLLVATTTSSATTTFRTGTFAAANSLRIEIYEPFNSVGGQPSLDFNGDGDGNTGTNYSYRVDAVNTGVFGSNPSAVGLATTMALNNGTTSSQYIITEGNNLTAQRKFFNTRASAVGGSGSDFPWQSTGGGNWNNTSNQITSILLRELTLTANGVPANTTIRVYGSSP